MRILGKFSIAAITFLSVACSLVALSTQSQSQSLPENEWSQIRTPSVGNANSLGFYSNGCIAGASTLPPDGIGYQSMRPTRNRYYGHVKMIQFIQKLGISLDAFGISMLVGDIGQPRGGPMPYGHTSHQIGLDTDIWFWSHPEQRSRSLTLVERDNLPFISMLDTTGKVDPNKFTATVIKKLKLAAIDPMVQRIFINPAIKIFLCDTLPKNSRAWLHNLRPWPGHDEHFHVRLYCPSSSIDCTPQAPVPEGDGCSEVYNAVPTTPTNEYEQKPNKKTPDEILYGRLFLKPLELPPVCETILRQK